MGENGLMSLLDSFSGALDISVMFVCRMFPETVLITHVAGWVSLLQRAVRGHHVCNVVDCTVSHVHAVLSVLPDAAWTWYMMYLYTWMIDCTMPCPCTDPDEEREEGYSFEASTAGWDSTDMVMMMRLYGALVRAAKAAMEHFALTVSAVAM